MYKLPHCFVLNMPELRHVMSTLLQQGHLAEESACTCMMTSPRKELERMLPDPGGPPMRKVWGESTWPNSSPDAVP